MDKMNQRLTRSASIVDADRRMRDDDDLGPNVCPTFIVACLKREIINSKRCTTLQHSRDKS